MMPTVEENSATTAFKKLCSSTYEGTEQLKNISKNAKPPAETTEPTKIDEESKGIEKRLADKE